MPCQINTVFSVDYILLSKKMALYIGWKVNNGFPLSLVPFVRHEVTKTKKTDRYQNLKYIKISSILFQSKNEIFN